MTDTDTETESETETSIRWGTGTRADSQFAREQILDAAGVCYLRLGVAKTTVEHVAKEAKVSRTTVYRYFANRDELLTSVVLRDAISMLAEVKSHLSDIEPMGEFLVRAMAYCVYAARKKPLTAMLFAQDGASMTSRLCISSEEILSLGCDLLEPYYQRALAAGEVPAGMQVWQIMEWVVRILFSFLTTPEPYMRSEQELTEVFRMFLLPALNQRP